MPLTDIPLSIKPSTRFSSFQNITTALFIRDANMMFSWPRRSATSSNTSSTGTPAWVTHLIPCRSDRPDVSHSLECETQKTNSVFFKVFFSFSKIIDYKKKHETVEKLQNFLSPRSPSHAFPTQERKRGRRGDFF